MALEAIKVPLGQQECIARVRAASARSFNFVGEKPLRAEVEANLIRLTGKYSSFPGAKRFIMKLTGRMVPLSDGLGTEVVVFAKPAGSITAFVQIYIGLVGLAGTLILLALLFAPVKPPPQQVLISIVALPTMAGLALLLKSLIIHVEGASEIEYMLKALRLSLRSPLQSDEN